MTQHNSNLSLNQQGSDVALLQSRLITIGYTIATPEILSEIFGQSTYQAVSQFQQREGLHPSGIVDPQTAQALINRFELDKTRLMPRPPSTPAPAAQAPHTPVPLPPTLQPPGLPHMQAPTPAATQQPVPPLAQPPGPPHIQDGSGQPAGQPIEVIRGSTPPPVQGLLVRNPGSQQPPPVQHMPVLQPGPQLPLPGKPGGSNGGYSVAGQVTDIKGEPLTRATVVAFGLNLRSSHELGRTVTDASGAYTIPYANGNGNRDMAAL
ncbi:MAG: peptidoglycan-binding protein, partial [Ktedonobacteraceae bacterium]